MICSIIYVEQFVQLYRKRRKNTEIYEKMANEKRPPILRPIVCNPKTYQFIKQNEIFNKMCNDSGAAVAQQCWADDCFSITPLHSIPVVGQRDVAFGGVCVDVGIQKCLEFRDDRHRLESCNTVGLFLSRSISHTHRLSLASSRPRALILPLCRLNPRRFLCEMKFQKVLH